jgi:hypothetical protein
VTIGDHPNLAPEEIAPGCWAAGEKHTEFGLYGATVFYRVVS